MRHFQITPIHINALVAIGVLTVVILALIMAGEYCGASGLGGVIGMVATTFARQGNGE